MGTPLNRNSLRIEATKIKNKATQKNKQINKT